MPSIARGITAQKAYRNAQEAPPFQARFRIIDSKYLLLGLIYLMGWAYNLCTKTKHLLTDQLKETSPPPNFSQIQTLQGVSRFIQFMLFFIVEML